MTDQEAVLSEMFEKSAALIEELRSDIESRDKTIKELKDALKQAHNNAIDKVLEAIHLNDWCFESLSAKIKVQEGLKKLKL